jgi:uncharacterized membrane protein
LGATLGALLGAILAAPFTAGASAAVAVAAIVRQVGGMIQPGDSAVFALLRASDPNAVASHFARYGGTILRTTLSPLAAARVQETIRA